MGYEWPGWALDALRDIEPHEVMQVLDARHRWPRQATGPGQVRVLTVWGRTIAMRPLIVAVRRVDEWTWWIVGARDLTSAEMVDFEKWEEAQDDD